MKRPRSPLYPAIGLPEAVSRVQKLSEGIGVEAVNRAEALRGLGFSGANGASLAALSAVRKFGLVSKLGGHYKLTILARDILGAVSPGDRATALNSAIRRPSLFSELLGRYDDSLPRDDQDMRDFLSGRGYSDTAIPQIITAYRTSVAFVQEAGDRSGGPLQSIYLGKPIKTEPFKVSMLTDRIEVSGTLMDRKTVDRLIQALTAMKSLLPVDEG